MQRTGYISDPTHWRERARKMRAMAADARDAQTKAKMLRVAEEYDRLAERAEESPGGNNG